MSFEGLFFALFFLENAQLLEAFAGESGLLQLAFLLTVLAVLVQNLQKVL